MADQRNRLRTTFDEAASLYDEAYATRRLFRGIADLIDDDFGGRIVKGYLTTLYVAQAQTPNRSNVLLTDPR